jgi:hypothetical protein
MERNADNDPRFRIRSRINVTTAKKYNEYEQRFALSRVWVEPVVKVDVDTANWKKGR